MGAGSMGFKTSGGGKRTLKGSIGKASKKAKRSASPGPLGKGPALGSASRGKKAKQVSYKG